MSGNFGLVDKLLKAGANGSAGWRGCQGRTLLDASALGGNGRVMSALLRAGCGPDMNVISADSGRSALYQSIVGGHGTAARTLVLVGADVHSEDPIDRRFLLHAAVSVGQDDLVGDLLVGGACANVED